VTEKIEEFTRLLQFPEVQEVLKEIVRSSLVESNIFARLNLIEDHLGSDDLYCIGRDLDFERGISEYDEEREPLPKMKEQMARVYTAIDTTETVIETTILGGNKTEMRARLLVDKLKTINLINGKRFMTGPDVSKWLLTEIADEYKTTKTGARQAARDVMEKAKDLFTESTIRINPETQQRNTKRGCNIIEYVGCKNM
jgi:hypothetical protein